MILGFDEKIFYSKKRMPCEPDINNNFSKFEDVWCRADGHPKYRFSNEKFARKIIHQLDKTKHYTYNKYCVIADYLNCRYTYFPSDDIYQDDNIRKHVVNCDRFVCNTSINRMMLYKDGECC